MYKVQLEKLNNTNQVATFNDTNGMSEKKKVAFSSTKQSTACPK
jgi:hypothetical protein